MPGGLRKRGRLAAAALVATGAALALTASAASAAPSCSATLFVPVDGNGAYVVEQPESAPGAIFCEPSLGGLEFDVAEAPAHGTVSALDPNGLGGASFTYTPSTGYEGADSFTLSADDGVGEPASVEVDVVVRPATDDAPVCSVQLSADQEGDGYRVESGAAVAGSIDCFDDEGAELSFAVQAPPGHGTLSEIEPEGDATASFTYTPSSGYQGPDAFALVANDGSQDSAPASIAVEVVPPADDPPRCTATLATTSDETGVYEVEQGETVRGAVTCVDEQPDALDFTVGAQPGHGALAPLSAPADGGTDLAYTPAPGYLGFDSFRVDVSDGANLAAPVTVRLRVVPARDDPPTCTAELLAPLAGGAYRVEQGATVSGELDCSDDEGAALSYAIATPPQHGSASAVGQDGHFSYTAPASYAGPDEIALLANDDGQDSQPVALEVEVVAAGEEGPVCQVALGAGANADGAYLIARNTGVQGRIACSGNPDLTVAAAPAHGSLSTLTPDGPGSATFAYSPAAGYLGADAFTLAADDGEAPASEQTVAVQVVEPSPEAPRCRARLHTAQSPDGYEVEAGETVPGTLTCFDPDDEALSFSVARAPAHGSVAGLAAADASVATFTYTAGGAWTGPDSFAVLASDGVHSSEPVEVEVTVVPSVDDPPECSISLFGERRLSGAYPAEEGEANPGVVACVDDEGEPLTFTVLAAPAHGAITGLESGGESAFFDFVADPGYLGPDAATVRVRDTASGEDVVALDVETGPAANTPPACSATLEAPLDAGAYVVVAGTPTPGEISCEDAELDPVAFSVPQAPGHGTLSALAGTGQNRSFTYRAQSGYVGSDQFALRGNDGRANSELVTITLLIQAPDATPPSDDGTVGPGTSAPPSDSSPAPSPPPPTSAAKPKKGLKCRKGFKKKTVKSKTKCVKVKKHRKRHN